MGCWDIFCPICGISMNTGLSKELVIKLKKYSIDWIYKCTFLTADGKIIHGVNEWACNIEFWKGKDRSISYRHTIEDIDASSLEEKSNNGIALHTDCWNYIKGKYGIELKYGHLYKEDRDYIIRYTKSKKDIYRTEKYWEQDFNFEELLEDKNDYMIYSPLNKTISENLLKKNLARINKVISELRINNIKERPSPSISATFYDEDTYKIGNDKNIWKVSSGKWVKQPTKNVKIKIPNKLNNEAYEDLMEGSPYDDICLLEKPIFFKIISLDKKIVDVNVYALL